MMKSLLRGMGMPSCIALVGLGLACAGHSNAADDAVDGVREGAIASLPTAHKVEVPAHKIQPENAGFLDARRRGMKGLGIFSYAQKNDHEDAGIFSNGGGQYAGMWGRHVIFPDSAEFNLPIPENSGDEDIVQILYAPTSRPPNGSCLEVGTAYRTRLGGSTTSSMYVYDFCSTPPNCPSGFCEWALDESFVENYTEKSENALRTYVFRIWTSAALISSKTVWSADLWNFREKAWVTFHSSKGWKGDDLRAWSIFETYFQPGQCSKFSPKFVATNLGFYDLTSKTWQNLTATMKYGVITFTHDGKQVDGKGNRYSTCFNDDSTGPASYQFSTLHDNDAWQVVPTGH